MRACVGVCVCFNNSAIISFSCQRCHTRRRQSPQLPWNQDWVCWPSSPPRRCRRRRRRRSLAPSVRATTAPGTRVSGTPTLLEPARGIHLSTRDEVSTVGMGWSTDGCHPVYLRSPISLSLSLSLLLSSLCLCLSLSSSLSLALARTHARTRTRTHGHRHNNNRR